MRAPAPAEVAAAVRAAVEAHTRRTVPPALRRLALRDVAGATRRLLEQSVSARSVVLVDPTERPACVALAVEVEHPLTRRAGGMIHTLAASPAREEALRAAMVREARARGWSWLRERRIWTAGSVDTGGWTPLYVRVTKQVAGPAAVEPDHPSGVVLRRRDPGDDEVLAAGLRESLRGGQVSWEVDDEHLLDAHVESLLGPESGHDILLAERGGRIDGFAIFQPHYADEFTGALETFLDDAFTFPGARGGGIAALLVRGVEALSRHPLLSGTVHDPAGDGAAVLQALVAGGWHPRECVWSRDLGDGR